MDRRAVTIYSFLLRQRADQGIEIARLKLVRVHRQQREIADAGMTGTSFEIVAERERREHSISPRAATRDDAALAIDEALFGQVAGAVDGIVDIHDAPV